MLDIKYNILNGGLYTVVEKEGCFYLFDLAYTFDHGVECMAFKCDADGHVNDYNEVYVSFPRTVTRENLVACVEEFMEQ